MRRGSRPETRQPRWPPVPEWAVAASAAAATAGGRPGNPAGREKNPRRMESHAESHEGWLTCAALP